MTGLASDFLLLTTILRCFSLPRNTFSASRSWRDDGGYLSIIIESMMLHSEQDKFNRAGKQHDECHE